MGITTNDLTHLFFGVPVMVYGYLIALDAYGALGKGRRLPPHAEFSFLVVFGFIVIIIDIGGYMGCPTDLGQMMCQDINTMHILFGVFMMAAGGLGLIHVYINQFKGAAMWFTPLTLSVVGVFMTQHEQEAEYGTFIHTSFGYSAIFSSVLRAATLYDPQKWSIFLAWSGTTTALTFVTGSDSMEDALSPRFMPHTVILGVCCISMLCLIPLLAFIHYMTRGKRVYKLHKPEKPQDSDSDREEANVDGMPLTNKNYE